MSDIKVRVILGGIVAGVVVFVWGAISHMLLGLGEVGIKKLSNEDAVLTSLAANVREPGFFFFPWIEDNETRDKVKTAEWEKKLQDGPSGIMIYKPSGGSGMTPGQLFREFAANTAWCLIAGVLLAVASPRLPAFGMRVLFVAAMGLISGLDIYVSYWNWYGFPGNYTAAVMFDEVIGFALAGAVLGAFIKPVAVGERPA